ncbi:MAG: energy transducer TonB [Bacteroidia bacterium]|nr:energy transducer TonB [Bacteroidia bacterium]
MDHNAENTNKPLALVFTLVSHGMLLLIFLYIYITTPIPPYPEGGGSGMGVNFGYSDEGSGNEQPEKLLPVELHEPVHTNPVHQKASSNNNILTQNNEETASVNTNDKKNDSNAKEETSTKEDVKTEKKKEIDKRTLFPQGDKNNNSKSEGDNKGKGDQGKLDGNPNNKNRFGNGNGDGNGNGNGIGDGDDKGNKKGNKTKDKGIFFSLKGREAKTLPVPEYNDNDQGKVVVEVIVDRDGNVKRVSEGKGTTTSSQILIKAAKKAAMNAKFTKNPDAAEEQKGSITYIFKQQ